MKRIAPVLLFTLLAYFGHASNIDLEYIDQLLNGNKYKKAYTYVQDNYSIGEAHLYSSKTIYYRGKVYDEVYRSNTTLKEVSSDVLATSAIKVYNELLSDNIHESFHTLASKRKGGLLDKYATDIKSRMRSTNPYELIFLLKELTKVDQSSESFLFAGKCADHVGDYNTATKFYLSAIDVEKQGPEVYSRVIELHQETRLNHMVYEEFLDSAIAHYPESTPFIKAKIAFFEANRIHDFEKREWIYKKWMQADNYNFTSITALIDLYLTQSVVLSQDQELREAKHTLEKAKVYLELANSSDSLSTFEVSKVDALAGRISELEDQLK